MSQKKLVKSKDKKIAGVCGGVAEYFNVDPTIIRLVWVILSLFYGTGILAYIVMAIVMPAPSADQGVLLDDEEIVDINQVNNVENVEEEE